MLQYLYSLKGAQLVRGQGRWNYSKNTEVLKQGAKGTNARQQIVTPWYRRGGTSVESSIPCSHKGRALVVKGAEEVENTEANSKYQDKVEE
ncbi:hypothetical protein B296_00045070 [Ensete ventricosum]|uniref:Uncharacterized protein n=1 Tax=Ensete ventricosum TaxID=4639 RepID=A0A426Z8N7_ENSVE|nr:hypothetical protein B296_00045070 [Ensete ventricosum]